MLIGAINAANGEANNVQNLITGEWGGVPKVAAEYREAGVPWVVVGDEVRSILPSLLSLPR
jgi:aconitate hydratase